MANQGVLLSKTLVIGIFILFIGMSVIPSTGNIVKDASAYYSSLEPDDSPRVEIITPKNGSIVYNSSVNISIKYSDDNGITNYLMIYGTYNHSGGSGGGWGQPKICYIFNKTILVTPGYNLIFATAYDKKGNVGYDFSIFYYYSDNLIGTSIPPKVEILYPDNGSVIYDKYVSMRVKCTDDNGVVTFHRAYCGRTGGGVGGTGVMEPRLEYYFNDTIRASAGYNWIIAWAYDVNGSIGYDITLYQYYEMKTSIIIGLMTDKEKRENYTSIKARVLLFLVFKPFTFNFYRCGEEIIISNNYIGYIGPRFIIGRFNAAIV